jgi:hypothetical protein
MYNKSEKLRIDGLKTEHVRIILLSVPTRKMENWFACREGDMQWRPIGEITEFYEDTRVLKGNPESTGAHTKKTSKPKTPPVHAKREERRPLFEDMADEILYAEDVVLTSRVKERRSTPRYPRKLDFSVRIDDKSFKCDTHDISMHGLSLNEPLPRWVPKTFNAKLSHAGSDVRIRCERVTDSKLQLINSESWDVIRKWIVKW